MFWVIRAVVDGAVDEPTGYVCNIKEIDGLLRDAVVPLLYERASTTLPGLAAVGPALVHAFPVAADRCPASTTLLSLELAVSPYLSFTVREGVSDMVDLTRSFEFAAAHRLYCEQLSAEENVRVFGKCSNPNGHGHNYVLEVTVSGTPDERSGTIIDLPAFERNVKERVIDRFDHKHLNLDCGDFESLNPSVENIAKVIWVRLDGAFERCHLTRVRVWESPKTYAEYRGES